MVPPTEPQNKWHVDRSLNLAVLLALGSLLATAIGTFGYGIWFASSQSTRLTIVEEAVRANAGISERLIRVETQTGAIHDDVKDIKQLLRTPQDQRR